ncbi:MAG: UDP-N-acetylmuramoyl-L-alanyl-D-glutamate--2,6-diaminopimelate ligase [Clostridiales Family XIII bacterium]|nr:UDP-N-acetylmuramoyl-L-alanyl-D-glutamate--2,6-diaminopimelate ligase [Clostridiales Family XIII bacterium]
MVVGAENVPVGGIEIDSRLVNKGDLFVATVGREADGHDFIAQAAGAGAAAVVVMETSAAAADLASAACDNGGSAAEGAAGGLHGAGSAAEGDGGTAAGMAVVAVPDTRAVLSLLVNRFYGDPSRAFTLIGITGTNGKTSTAVLTEHILCRAGHRTGLLGTIKNLCCGEPVDIQLTMTTPDCVDLGKIMRHMADEGIADLVMEVSSMGLKMGRVDACDFDVGVFTNMSPEHLDDHGTMEDYLASKLMLMDLAKSAAVNMDDPVAESFIERANERAKGKVIRFGIKNKEACDIFADKIEYSAGGVSFDMNFSGERARVAIGTPAEFAVYNALAAAAAAMLAGIGFDGAVAALNTPAEIAGRYQVLTSADGVAAIVDYAHTARALENLLEAVRANPSYRRIVSVFGCGGDRDPSKRAPMGEISGRLADYTVITSDNPRTEDPAAIIDEVERGVKGSGGAYEVEPDRATAIDKAIRSASAGNVIVIAGKGHEDYQIIGREKIHLDDREVAAEALRERDENMR